jgi:hypothetical protein
MNKLRTLMQVIALIVLGLLVVYGLAAMLFGGQPLNVLGAVLQDPIPLTPPVINYQGYLRDMNGDPVEGTFEMTFRLYDEPAGGLLLHQEAIPNVVVRDGMFTVLLGDIVPLDAEYFKSTLYASVQVGTENEMLPRQRIAPAAYAVQLTDGVFVDSAGQVGIGNQDPQQQLDVTGNMNLNGDAMLAGHVNIGGDLGVTGAIHRAGEDFIGPHFITPVTIITSITSCPATAWTTYALPESVPDDATAIILDYKAWANAGNGFGINIRRSDTETDSYVLTWGRANGTGDEPGWGGQGTYPFDQASGSFQYEIDYGYNLGCTVRLVGYYK